MTQLATFIVHCGKHIQRRKCELYSTYVRQSFMFITCETIMYVVCFKCVPADTDLNYDFNCLKCSA